MKRPLASLFLLAIASLAALPQAATAQSLVNASDTSALVSHPPARRFRI